MNINMESPGGMTTAGARANDWEFYGLSGDGFRLTADTRLHFRHSNYLLAAQALGDALAQREGLVVVTGLPGTGKTTLAEDLLTRLRAAGRNCGALSSTRVGAEDLLRLVASAFGLNMQQPNKAALLTALERHFVDHHQPGEPAVLLIDEAQNLGRETLDELLLLGNLTLDAEPLLQVFFFGQQHLWQQFEQADHERLLQHIVCAHQLQPLDAEQTRAYIGYRLSRVGWEGRPRISGGALGLIHGYTEGIPRRINGFMSQLLRLGVAERKLMLDTGEVEQVVAQLADAHLQPSSLGGTDPFGINATAPAPILKPLDSVAAMAWHEPARGTAAAADAQSSDTAHPASSGHAHPSRTTKPTDKQAAGSGRRTRKRRRSAGVHQRVVGRLAAAAGRWLKALKRVAGSLAPGSARLRQSAGGPASTGPRPGAAHFWPSLQRRLHSIEWDASMALTAITAAIGVGMLVVVANSLREDAQDTRPPLVQVPQVQPQQVAAAIGFAELEMPPANPVEVARLDPAPRPVPEPEPVAPQPTPVSFPVALTALPDEEQTALNTEIITTESEGAARQVDADELAALSASSISAAEWSVADRLPDELLAPIINGRDMDELSTMLWLDELPATAAGPEPWSDADAEPAYALQDSAGVVAASHVDPAEQPAPGPEQPDGAAPVVGDPAADILALLARANKAMQASRYTLPPNNSAFAYFKQVLALAPDNSHARAGIAEIAGKYRQMARDKLDTGDLDGAERIVKRGLRADPQNRRLLDLIKEVRSAKSDRALVAELVPIEPALTQVQPLSADGESASNDGSGERDGPNSVGSGSFFIH